MKCENCIYYYQETDFCLNHMYNVKNPENCRDFKDNIGYNMNTVIGFSDLEFNEELVDSLGDNLTVGGLFRYLDKVMFGVMMNEV